MCGLGGIKMEAKKKAVITILGLIGHTKKEQYIENNEIRDRFVDKEDRDKAKYTLSQELSSSISLEEKNYINMLTLLAENSEEILIAVGTSKAISIQKEAIDFIKTEKDISYIEIEDESEYASILKVIDNTISKYDEVIFDVSHGFRHLPILATVALIVKNIKDANKIQHILFAKEINPYTEYKIIDLKEYLDLASLSFVLANFKDNYTTSNHIKINNKNYIKLIESMNYFSANLMALSLEHLLVNSTPNLISEIDNILEDEMTILEQELVDLKTHLKNNFSKKSHRYETYYYLAKDLKEKGYLVQALSLLFESVGFYIKTSFSKFSVELKKLIDKEENSIKNGKSDYYKLTNACRSYMLYSKDKDANACHSQEKKNTDYKLKDYRKIIYSQVENKCDFRKFCKEIGDRRNNLLHSNSGETIDNIVSVMDRLMSDYEKFCIDGDVLKFDSTVKIKEVPKKN